MKLLYEYKDCFAWSYDEMLWLDKELIEHEIPIKQGYQSHIQSP